MIGLERYYYNLPILLQDIMCTVYGLKLYRERYGRSGRISLRGLLSSQFMAFEDVNKIQASLLNDTLHHALESVEFYKDISLKVPDSPHGKDISEMLSVWPIIDKETVRSSPDGFISSFFKKTSLIKLHTSGTTGTPLTVYIDPAGRRLNYAFFERSKRWAGINGFEPSITLAGRPIVSPDQNVPPYWRRNFFLRNTLFSSYHLSSSNMIHYIKEIERINPKLIDSYPSSIEHIADYCLRYGIDTIRPKAIITSAETLFDHQRQKIEEAFGCRVYDQYGCTEQVVFVCQCECGSYHVNPEYGLLEVLDVNDRPVKPGEIGDFVCTGFTNKAMPLIRYRTGDMGIISEKLCECGRSFPVVEKIIGRNDEILITPDGRYIGRLDPIFKGVKNTIKEAQIVQEKRDHIVVYVVKDDDYQKQDGEYIIRELEKRIGSSMEYSLVYVDRIPRTKNGKFRALVNKLTSHDAA